MLDLGIDFRDEAEAEEAAPPTGAEAREAYKAGLAKTRGGFVARIGKLFGKKKIDLELVSALEFAGGAGRQEVRKPGILYRVKGEPVPGKLLGLTGEKIKIDTAEGTYMERA